MTGPTLDPTRRYLAPVARLNLPTEPDDVHLSVYEWNPRLGEWLHGWAICGRSVEQGRLPDGTQVTCAKCLEAKPGYERVLAEQARAAAERAAAQAESPFGEVLRRAGVTREAFDRAFDAISTPAPPADALRDQLAEALRDRIRRAAVPGMRPVGGGAIGNLMGATEHDLADAVLATPELAQRLAHLADYENRITWETNCGEHARLLDSCYAETVRAEKAEAELRRASALHADTERRLRADLAAEVRKREAARALHRPYNLTSGEQRCFTCVSTEAYPNGVAVHEPWPCPTVRALDAPEES